MSDLVSRDAAIKAIECVNDSICAQQAIDALCDLPSARQWISVTERLPEKAGSYLVTLQENENAISLGGDDPFVWVKFFDGRKWHNNSWYDVLAWREKPEPWRGEEG